MASIGHLAVGVAAGRLYAEQTPGVRPWRAMVAMSALSFAADIDVIAFRFGIPYGAPFGHRGASHSFAFALGVGLLCLLAARASRLPPLRTGVLAALVYASHGLLDTLTDGGLGIGLLWPFDLTRYFAPFRPIPVAPIGKAFLSPRGLYVAAVELAYFLPLFLWAFWPRRQRVR